MVRRTFITLGFGFWVSAAFVLSPYALMVVGLINAERWTIVPASILLSYFIYSGGPCGFIKMIRIRKKMLKVTGEFTFIVKSQYSFKLEIDKIKTISFVYNTNYAIDSKGEKFGIGPYSKQPLIIITTVDEKIYRILTSGFSKKQTKRIVETILKSNNNIIMEKSDF